MREWTKFKKASIYAKDGADGLTQDEIDGWGQPWINNLYQVLVRETTTLNGEMPVTHLSIKRIDRTPIHDWRDLQRIKNELCGPKREGIEIYPSEERLIDTANQYHLWVLPVGMMVPFGFTNRLVLEAVERGSKAIQRPFDERPADLEEQERVYFAEKEKQQ